MSHSGVNSIRTRLSLAFALVTSLTLVGAAVSWGVFGLSERSLGKLVDESLPLMRKASALDSAISHFEAELGAFRLVDKESERNARYLSLLDESAAIDDLIYDISDTIKQDSAALDRMAAISATLATTISTVNNAVEQRIAAAQHQGNTAAAGTDTHTAIEIAQKACAAAEAGARELRKVIADYVAATDKDLRETAQIANDVFDGGRSVTVGVALASIVLSILVGWLYVGRNLIARLSGLVVGMRSVAQGKLDAVFSAHGDDEIGEMSEALEVFRRNAQEMERLRKEQAGAQQRAQEQRRNAMIELAGRCDNSVMSIAQHVASAATEMQATAEGLSGLASDTARQSGDVAHGAQGASANVQAMAAATIELSQSIREIAVRMTETATLAREAAAHVKDTNATVDGLKGTARQVGEILSVINEIAAQTNLLALNATIEAARAGEAGKGFAVVAAEVKQLASQTAKATDDISRQVDGMQRVTGKAVAAIDHISQTVSLIDEISSAVADAITEQGAAVDEMARNAQQAADGTGQVSRNIGGVTSASERTGVAASQVLSASGDLAQYAERLRREVSEFLAFVRAA